MCRLSTLSPARPVSKKVRVKEGESFAETYARLTIAQQDELVRLTNTAASLYVLNGKVARLTATFHRACYDAVNRGVPVRMIADMMEVTPSRVYQIYDLVHDKQIGQATA